MNPTFRLFLQCLLSYRFKFYEHILQYLKSLQLKTILVLSSDCLDTPLLKFLDENNVTMRVVEQTLITEEMITESLKV